jgi:hypothetical protein
VLLSGCRAGQLPALESALAAQDSATAALGDWCAAHRLADPPTITARQLAGETASPPGDVVRLLGNPPAETIGYRHVELSCGRPVLSVAHNWYVKDRLTPAMNAALDTSDTPFGKVVTPLHFTRERLAATRGAAPGCPAGTILSHRALLRLPDGQPLSLVVECYQRALMR